MPQLSGILDIIKALFQPVCDMATDKLTAKVQSLEGKLNTFATLVNDRHPEYGETLNAVYKELEEIKELVSGKTPEKAPA